MDDAAIGPVQDWRAVSARLAAHPAVFIAGVPRSGTTALVHTLSRLESFRGRVARNPETAVFQNPHRLLELGSAEQAADRSEIARLLRYLDDDASAAARVAAVARAATAVGGARRGLAAVLERLPVDAARGAAFRLRGWHHATRAFFAAALEVRAAARVLEKTPQHLGRLPEMRATFPRAHLVLCLRHPVDVLSSYRKRLEADRAKGKTTTLHWLGVATTTFCRDYRVQVARILGEQERRPASTTIVRYEELTARPDAELERLCVALGEPFDAAALLEEVGEERDDHGSPRGRGRIVANEKEWEAFLPRAEAVEIEALLADVMDRLGYSSYTSRRSGAGAAGAAPRT